MKKIINYIKSVLYKNHKNKPQPPTLLNFPITDNCNSKCQMCNIWEERVKDEITLEQIRVVFKKEYFSKIKHIGISGGEPTLRKDLVQCIDVILQSVMGLESISITSHGFHSKRWSRFAPDLVKLCKEYDVAFSINISIDGIEDTHDRIRGIEGAFIRACNTIRILKDNSIPVQIQCTVSKDNVYAVSSVLAFAKEEGVDCIFRCATEITRLYNSDIIDNIALDDDQKSFLADFFLSSTLHEQTISISRGLYYEKMAVLLTSKSKRNMPCYFQYQGMLLSSKGEISPCSVSKNILGNVLDGNESNLLTKTEYTIRRDTVENECGSCIHDQSGAWSPKVVISYLLRRRNQKIYGYLNIANKVPLLVQRLFKALTCIEKPKKIDKKKVKSILIIGAYGGEHVGDAAILGGVILRCLSSYENIDKIYVSSFRKLRTKRWINSLDFTVDIECVDDELALNQKIDIDLLVYGGGPLMELPLHLGNHLHTAIGYSKLGIPFIIEGVGIGPIKTKITDYFVKKLLKISSFTRVRTTKAKADVYRMTGLDVSLSQDPAFDYLKSRTDPKNLSKHELISLNKLVDSASAELVVAINLRPLWNKYSFIKERSTEEVELNYLKELTTCFNALSKEYNIKFVFFPMNADQFGMSDFETANRLKRLMSKVGLVLHIWEAEPGIDAVIKFLRTVDCVVSMRFHGCIFALSQCSDNVISIDYQLGKPGKVTDVMNDNGLTNMVNAADTLKSSEIKKQIESILLKSKHKHKSKLINKNIPIVTEL
jgi:MoaA/NifB/PqqE/SkfB family radical SAM enzyme/polysaccharide pyruvyl transferase WcaK-like protein